MQQHEVNKKKNILDWAKETDIKACIPYDFIYVHFRNRQNQAMVIEVRIVITTGMEFLLVFPK